MPVANTEHVERTSLDHSREQSELQASRQAETKRLKPLPKATAFIAGIALVVLGALVAVGPVGVILLSPPDVQEEFLVICGLHAPPPSANGQPSSGGGIGQAVGIFGMGLTTVAAVVGSGVILITKSKRDRRRVESENAQAVQRINAIDARLAQVAGDAGANGHSSAGEDLREPS